MATLKARGREEWLRMEVMECRRATSTLPALNLKRQRAYMSDGHVLERVVFLKEDGSVRFDGGWKDQGKTNAELATLKQAYVARGWKVLSEKR